MKKVKIINGKEYTVGKIVCVGKNYVAHAEEMGGSVPNFPMIFLKAPSTLVYNEDEIIHPNYSNEMHHEVELVLLIGKNIRNANDENAQNSIAGFAVGLDMTLRDLQRKFKQNGEPWTLAKNFDTCAVVSEFVSSSEINLTGTEKIELYKNGNLQQSSTLDKMVFSPVEIIKYVSERMTLEKGDLIFTGTPEGVSKVAINDVLEAEIENIGHLKNIIRGK